MKRTFIFLIFLYCINPTFAFALYEPFLDATASGGSSYSIGSPLQGQTNAAGTRWFTANSSAVIGSPQVLISSGNLSVAGLATSTGNSIRFGGGDGFSARFSGNGLGSVTSGTIYYSFAFQLTDITGLNVNGQWFAGFNTSVGNSANNPGGGNVSTKVIAKASGGGFQLGTDNLANLSATSYVFADTIFNINVTIFVVGSYTFNPGAGDDVSRLWINPDASTFGGTEPTGFLQSTGTTAGTDQATVSSFLFMNRQATQPAGIVADELRIGTSWAEVTPIAVPEPTTVILTGISALGLIFARRFNK